MIVWMRAALCLTLFTAHAAWAESLVANTDDAGVSLDASDGSEAGDAGVDALTDAGAATPTPVEPVQAAAEPEPTPAPAGRSAHHAFRVWLGGGLVGSDLNFNDTSVGRLRHPGAGTVNVGLSVFPGAALTSNALAHLGAFVMGDLGVGLISHDVNDKNRRFAQSGSRLRFGVQGRIPLSDDLAIVLHGGWSRLQMDTANESLNSASLLLPPDVLLNGLRGGLSLHWHVWERLSAELGLAGQYLLELGQLRTNYFPNATGAGLDANVVLSVELLPHLSVRATFEWQRSFFSLKPSVPQYTATSGYDNSLWLNVGLLWSM